MLITPNPCAILRTSASFSHVQQVIQLQADRTWRALDARHGMWRCCDAAAGVRPAKPDSHLDNRISGAAQHRAAGCPWHSRCHYPRSHSISGTVVVLAAGSLPAGLAPSENRTGCSIGDRSAPLRTSTYCRSSSRCADGPLKCGPARKALHPRQLHGSRGIMDPGGAQPKPCSLLGVAEPSPLVVALSRSW